MSKASLDSMLRRSGFNKLYLTLQDWQQQVLADYALVWIAGDREAAAQAAAQLGYQMGIVRAKQRFGIRVTAGKFQEAFKSLHPAHVLPSQIQVRQVFKASGPPKLRAADLTA